MKPTTFMVFRAHIVAALLAALAVGPAHAEATKWESVAQVEAVAVTIHRVTQAELNAVVAEFEKTVSARGTQVNRKGFSILRTNRETGARRCDVWVLADLNTKLMTDTLGHEMTHCAGYAH